MHSATAQGQRIAFFGGSFDPPHNGHLAVARAALQALQLDKVLFAPVGTQPLKPHGASAGFADRLAMTQLAIAGQPNFRVSLADAPSSPAAPSGPNYTIDTLLRLRQELPAGSVLFCLMGADSFRSLRRWHRAAEIPFAAPLIVAARPGQQMTDLAATLPAGLQLETSPSAAPQSMGTPVLVHALRNAAGDVAPFYVLPDLHIDISASQIRAEIHHQATRATHLLPESVARYIAGKGLYR
ncbi:MAG: nicotinate (nicotinamide) nucleotide adenylyltransferase [Terracidiphilus sp.]